MSFAQKLPRRIGKAVTSIATGLSRLIDNCMVALEPESEKASLVILDDFFPDILSAFRIAEYNYYLGRIPKSQVHSSRVPNLFFASKASYQKSLQEYAQYHPQFVQHVRRFNSRRRLDCGLFYTVFINNAYKFIDYIDRHRLPFVFTLYPGGGFYLNNIESDYKLRRVMSSPNFKKVIVTQKITQEYLIDNNFCDPSQVVFIYGCALNTQKLISVKEKKRFRIEKRTLDICFVAAKYIARGVDKGYDVFVEAAKRLAEKYDDVRFHVVGSFDSSDIDVSAISDRITFYGLRNTDFFPEFYSGMDIVLSPNLPFVLAPGAFDGFPTGSCMEAGLCGVAVFCTDPLKLNIAFKADEEIVIISNDPGEVAEKVSYFHTHSDELYKLATAGKAAFRRELDLDHQMKRRVEVFEDISAII